MTVDSVSSSISVNLNLYLACLSKSQAGLVIKLSTVDLISTDLGDSIGYYSLGVWLCSFSSSILLASTCASKSAFALFLASS